MVSDQLIIYIFRLLYSKVALQIYNILRKGRQRLVICKSSYILIYFLCDCRRKNSRISSGIGHKLFLIKLLNYIKCICRTNLEESRTVILKLRKVIKHWRILLLSFLRDTFYLKLHRRRILQILDQFLRILLLLETIFLIKLWTIKISASRNCLPFSIEKCQPITRILRLFTNLRNNSVKWSYYEFSDLTLSLYDHSENTGHNTSDRYDTFIYSKILLHGIAVLKRQCTREIDTHKVVLLGTKVGRACKIIIIRKRLRAADTT